MQSLTASLGAMTLLQNETRRCSLEEQLNDAQQTIAALTLKVAQLQGALDDKETQFRDLIRRYAKRDAHVKSNTNGAKSANGSATNVSSSGVSIQSTGDASSSATVSPTSKNRSLTDSATQTANSDDDMESDDELDSAALRHPYGNISSYQRQISLGFPTPPSAGNDSANSTLPSDFGSVSKVVKVENGSNNKPRRPLTNGSVALDANGNAMSSIQAAKYNRTPTSQANATASQVTSTTPNRVSYAEYGVRNETDYVSLAAFASTNPVALTLPSPPDVETDIVASSQPHSKMSSSALPAVVPVPIPVRMDAARRPDSLNWPQSAARPAAPPTQAPSQPLLATYSSGNFAAQSTNVSTAPSNGYQPAASGANNAPRTNVTNPSPATNGMNDKQELALRCLDLPVSEWKAGHVIAWLELHAGLQPFAMRCAENIKSGAILNSMSDSELEQSLGIENPLHKRKLQLALAELRSGTYKPHLKVNSLTHIWIARTWLRELGLPQYAFSFEQSLVDGRLLTTLSKKDLEKYLHVEKKSHQASIIRSIELLRRFSFDVQAIADRRARCEYVNADLLVWTNRRLSVWLKEIDLLEFSKIEQTGLNGAYIVYEALSIDSLCTALHIPSSKPLVRKHLEAKFSEVTKAAVPTAVTHGDANTNTNTNGLVNYSGNPQFSSRFPNDNANVYTTDQSDYINLDANGSKASSGSKSRNYVVLESSTRESGSASSATRSALPQRTGSMHQTLTAARPIRNAELRSKMDDSDLPDREHDSEKNSKFVRSSSASRSTSRKMAGLRNSLGKAFSKRSNNSQSEDKAN